MRRVLYLVLVLLLAFSSMALASPEMKSPGSTGRTYLVAPRTQLGGPTTSARIQVDKLLLENATLDMQGKVSYDDQSHPIHLSGTFYQSRIGHPSDKVAAASDLTGTFQVVHLAIRHNPASDFLLVNQTARGPVLFLYLLRNETREVTLFEIPARELAQQGVSELLNAAQESGHFASDFWAHKLFEPVEAGEDPRVQFVEDTDPRTYSETYQQTPSCSLTYKISFQAYMSGPSGIGIGDGEFNHELKITRKWTESNCPVYVEEDSPFVIGTYDDPVTVLLRASGDGTNYGDVYLKGRYGGTHTTKASFPASVSVRVGVTAFKFFSLSGNLTLCCPQNQTKGIDIFYPQGSEWAKRAEHTYDDRYLPSVNNNFTAVAQVAWGVGSYGLRETRAEWYAPVYADWDDLSPTLYYRATYYPTTSVYYYSGN
jgi:hypothetical protein